jgi:hypothetical protein
MGFVVASDEAKAELAVESSALDADVRLFVGRLMSGYEAAMRSMRDMSEASLQRAKDAEALATKTLNAQILMVAEREKLLSLQHKRDLEAVESAARVEMMQEVKGKLVALVPLLLKRLAGIPLTGDDSHGLQDFLGSLSGDQLGRLMQEGTLTLDEAQRELLLQTLGSLAAAEQKEAAALKEAKKDGDSAQANAS